RSTSSRMRCLSSALNLRRWAFAATSGSGELARKGTAVLVSLTMILLAALLCNYGRGKCLIIIGTEGSAVEAHGEEVSSAEMAWEFINELYDSGEIERPAALPQFLPRQFHKDYRSHCALLLAKASPAA